MTPEPRAWWEGVDPGRAGRAAAAAAAAVVLVVGVAPMAAAAVDRAADPGIALDATGPPSVVASPAPPFTLVDQAGRPVSTASLRGHVVVLTFLDPVCTTDCPIIAQELRVADSLLGADARRVQFVAVVANRIYRSPEAVAAFDRQEGLDALPNWTFLTGTEAQLAAVWDAYGVSVETAPAGGMAAHSDTVFVIDGDGVLRRVLNADTGGADAATRSSFSGLLVQQVDAVLHR